MKKIFILIISISFLLPLDALAQKNSGSVKQVKVNVSVKTNTQKSFGTNPRVAKSYMRIFVKDGEETISKFPSVYLKTNVRMTIVFPEGYNNNSSLYPVVYMITKNNFTKEELNRILPPANRSLQRAVFVTINLPLNAKIGGLGNFISKEIFPYFETNYKIDSNPQKIIIAAADTFAVNLLEILAAENGYFKNAALLLHNTTPLPLLPKMPQDINLWVVGSLSNMARLQFALENSGLEFIKNFAYKIDDAKTSPWDAINFDFFLNKSTIMPNAQMLNISANQISAASEEAITVFLDIKTKNGASLNYVPAKLKFSPPFLRWEQETASLFVIYGATQTKVKISGRLPFGKGFTTHIKIIK